MSDAEIILKALKSGRIMLNSNDFPSFYIYWDEYTREWVVAWQPRLGELRDQRRTDSIYEALSHVMYLGA